MSSFFPHHTENWKIEEPAALRRLSISLIEMAAITGVVLRLYRALTITLGPTQSLIYIALMPTIGILFLCVMTTLHLGNFPVRS
ncbi:MAG: hypothetical protein H7066_13710, partial [Cytophagaceae bacterium]|nr:hypothetical protein [Gemmatimonadaceae bacterium]